MKLYALLPLVPLLLTACSARSDATRSSSSADNGDDGGVAAAQPTNFDTVPGLVDGNGDALTLYRGAAPDHSGLLYLQQLGVQTIVCLEKGTFPDDFEGESTDAIDAEEADAQSLGITFVRAPLSAWLTVDSNEVDLAESTIANASDGPVYVHCLHGEDRTGLVVGLARVQLGSMAPADAHQDMIDHGFHTALPFLNEYFENQTGWED
jgi:tyrosine-protein phosphatase SIW14